MTRFILLFLLFTSQVFAIRIDPNASSYGHREKKRVETFDFRGEYPHLTDVDIDAKRKKDVEVILNGSYPMLEKINFEGGFGTISGDLSGAFPKLKEITITCTEAKLDLNLQAKFEEECTISIVGKGDMEIILPQEVGLFVTVSASPFCKVNNNHPTLVQKKRKITQRIFLTPDQKEKLLKIAITADKGEIILK